MKGSEVRLFLQDFCAQETRQKGDGLIALSARGGERSAVAPAEQRLWSLQTVWLHRVEALSCIAQWLAAVLG